METFKLHPTGRSEDASQTKVRRNEIIRKELLQSSKAARQSREASQTRKTRVDKTHSVYGMLLSVCGLRKR